MNRKIVSAVFTGENGSLGYFRGYKYTLVITRYGGDARIKIHRDGVTEKTKKGFCIYSSIIEFLSNWSEINVIS